MKAQGPGTAGADVVPPCARFALQMARRGRRVFVACGRLRTLASRRHRADMRTLRFAHATGRQPRVRGMRKIARPRFAPTWCRHAHASLCRCRGGAAGRSWHAEDCARSLRADIVPTCARFALRMLRVGPPGVGGMRKIARPRSRRRRAGMLRAGRGTRVLASGPSAPHRAAEAAGTAPETAGDAIRMDPGSPPHPPPCSEERSWRRPAIHRRAC